MSLATDAHWMILNGLEPAEAIQYVPHEGIPRTVFGTVRRHPPQGSERTPFSQRTNTVRAIASVFLVNDPITGISGPRVGRDELHFKEHLCDLRDTRFMVTAVLSEDAGMYEVEVVK